MVGGDRNSKHGRGCRHRSCVVYGWRRAPTAGALYVSVWVLYICQYVASLLLSPTTKRQGLATIPLSSILLKIGFEGPVRPF
eukprot:3225930-Pleurochrysis_carterae.AAC.1